MTTNAEKSDVREWLNVLSAASRKERNPKLWKRVHRLVSVPTRRRVSVNLYKLDKYTREGDNVIVPGKVLSVGEMTHKLNIAAMEFSAPALKRLHEADCKIVRISDMINSDRVRVIV